VILIAYIDAALGSMLLQALAGTVLTGLLMGRRFLMAPFAWLGSRRTVEECDAAHVNEKSDPSVNMCGSRKEHTLL